MAAEFTQSVGALPHQNGKWHAIDWQAVSEEVRRLQARIVKAMQEGRWGKVKALQHLLTHSFSGRAMAVRRVTENDGKKTAGVDGETWNTPQKKAAALHALKQHGYKPQPLRRVYIPKSNGKKRPLGIPTMQDRAMQALYLLGLDPIAECTADLNSYGFRRERSCADAIEKSFLLLCHKGSASWILEGDIQSCFDRISHEWLLEHVPMDKTILRKWLKAGFLHGQVLSPTEEGTPQGGIISPILSNLVLDKLDKYIETQLIPAYTRGERRKTNPPYVVLTFAASEARKSGDLERAKQLSQQAQALPSRDPQDPDFRRLWYARYADDFLLGLVGTKAEALEIKEKIATFLRDELKLQLSDAKTLVTHARDEVAKFLGYEIHVLHADDKHDYRGQRCINGSVGLRVPWRVKKAQSAKYMRHGKPIHLPQRLNDDAYSIVAQYQAEYRGVVQYYRMAYNLHTLGYLKRTMELSLVKTLANKYKTTRQKVYARHATTIDTPDGRYKVLQVRVERDKKKPLVSYFGGVSLRWNKWVAVDDNQNCAIWNGRSEVVERLLAQECELCGSTEKIEVHHIRKLADVAQKGRTERPEWMRKMSARRRKTLVVCLDCHHKIQYGRYDGKSLRTATGEPREKKTLKRGSAGGDWKSVER